MSGKRAQARVDTIAEIKRCARIQIAEKGAADLSLREIARDMEMASSALYRYFESRDHLLTELIIDDYNMVGVVVECADQKVSHTDVVGRWRAIAHSLRTWALAHPSNFGLIFGTPIPGYEAPADTVAPAMRYTNVLLHLLSDAHAMGRRSTVPMPPIRGISQEYKKVRTHLNIDVPDEMLMIGLTAWAALLGALSLEIYGHVDTVFSRPGLHFDALTDMLGQQMFGTK